MFRCLKIAVNYTNHGTDGAPVFPHKFDAAFAKLIPPLVLLSGAVVASLQSCRQLKNDHPNFSKCSKVFVMRGQWRNRQRRIEACSAEQGPPQKDIYFLHRMLSVAFDNLK